MHIARDTTPTRQRLICVFVIICIQWIKQKTNACNFVLHVMDDRDVLGQICAYNGDQLCSMMSHMTMVVHEKTAPLDNVR